MELEEVAVASGSLMNEGAERERAERPARRDQETVGLLDHRLHGRDEKVVEAARLLGQRAIAGGRVLGSVENEASIDADLVVELLPRERDLADHDGVASHREKVG